MNLHDTIVDAIWEGFDANACVDRSLNRICDTGDHPDFDMAKIAEHVIEKLSLTQTWAPATVLHDGYVDPDTQWEYDTYDDARRQIDIFNQWAANRQQTATRVVGRWTIVDDV